VPDAVAVNVACPPTGTLWDAGVTLIVGSSRTMACAPLL
jgi:hypothetical protein